MSPDIEESAAWFSSWQSEYHALQESNSRAMEASQDAELHNKAKKASNHARIWTHSKGRESHEGVTHGIEEWAALLQPRQNGTLDCFGSAE